MHILYADESGDVGLPGASSYFILSGLVVHEDYWFDCYQALYNVRVKMKNKYNIKLKEEIHTTTMFNEKIPTKKKNNISKLPINDQIAILNWIIDALAKTNGVSIYSVIFDKNNYKGVQKTAFDNTWKTFIQRFENTIIKANFNGCSTNNEHGLIFADQTESSLKPLFRQMRNYNPIPKPIPHPIPNTVSTRQAPIKSIIGDINMVNSAHSYFVQSADIIAYLTKQYIAPNRIFRKKGRKNLYKKLTPIYCTAIGIDGIKKL